MSEANCPKTASISPRCRPPCSTKFGPRPRQLHVSLARTPGSFGCHELLDRTSLLTDSLERFVLSHPACVHNKEWFALAYQAVSHLNDLYQKVGAEHV